MLFVVGSFSYKTKETFLVTCSKFVDLSKSIDEEKEKKKSLQKRENERDLDLDLDLG